MPAAPTAAHKLVIAVLCLIALAGCSGRVQQPNDYGEVNALIGLPLAYGYSTTMRPEPPPSRRELLLNRGGGWAVRYPRATATAGPQGLPLVSARRWDTGASAGWDGAKVQAAVAVTVGTLSAPRTDDDNDGRQLSGRVGVTPTFARTRWMFGFQRRLVLRWECETE